MWCCKTTEDQCITDEYDEYNIICNGTALSLSDQCHDEDYDGPSCNYYPLDNHRHYHSSSPHSVTWDHRSYIDLCQDNRYLCATLQSRVHKEVSYKSFFPF